MSESKRKQVKRQPLAALLIDPETHSVRDVTYTGLESMYEAIGCRYVDCVREVDGFHDVFVDDNGLEAAEHFFAVKGYPSPLAGRGFVIGHNGAGDAAAVKITKEELAKRVRFYERAEGLLMQVVDGGYVPTSLEEIANWATT